MKCLKNEADRKWVNCCGKMKKGIKEVHRWFFSLLFSPRPFINLLRCPHFSESSRGHSPPHCTWETWSNDSATLSLSWVLPRSWAERGRSRVLFHTLASDVPNPSLLPSPTSSLWRRKWALLSASIVNGLTSHCRSIFAAQSSSLQNEDQSFPAHAHTSPALFSV